MLWKGRRESGNILDQRSIGGKSIGAGGLILGAFVVYLLGGDPVAYLNQNAGNVQRSAPVNDTRDNEKKSFVGVVLAETEDAWTELFSRVNRTYRPPELVLFRNRVNSQCGRASSASGPFYCPPDQRVYLDLSFLDELSRSLGAKGDFAEAYVIAHEVGHHVQNLLGFEEAARRQQQGLSDAERNRVSVGIELQADCFAGVWAKQVQGRGILEAGDVEEAIGAASAVGDDRLQQRGQGYVVPDSFTHGSSAQRMSAFQKGFSGGDIEACS
jgi:predicted metalloprotease